MNLTADPIPGLVRRIAVPAGTGMMFTTFFNITDTWFAGLLSTEALAALSLSFPVFFLVIAAGVGLQQGTIALIANALGATDKNAATRLWLQSMYLAILIAIAVALIGLFGLSPILRILTLDARLLQSTAGYLLPLLLFGVFFMAGQTTNALLVAQGDSRSYRNALIVGFVANIALNPLLMFGLGPLPGGGVVGIALATVIVQAGQLAYLLHQVHRCGLLRPQKNLYGLSSPLIWALVKQIIPASLGMLAVGAGLFIITHFFARFGPEAVAAYGIGLRIEQLAMLPMIGVGIAALSLCGQNFGAGKLDRVYETIGFTLIAASALMVAGAIAVSWLKMPILRLFSDDPIVLEIGQSYLTVAVWIFNAYALLHVCTSIMQGLKKPIAGMTVGIVRHVMAPPIILSFATVSFGLTGVYWSIFGLSWAGAAMMVFWLWRELRRIGGLPLQAAEEPAAQ